MGNLLINANSIPVAILNGGYGGAPSSFFLRNDAAHNDLLTNYGRLLFRMQKGGLVGALRSILFYQGEADNGQGAQYQANFTAIRSACQSRLGSFCQSPTSFGQDAGAQFAGIRPSSASPSVSGRRPR
jgi:hypothetical protein